MNAVNPFHLAIPVQDLQVCRAFYKNILGCKEGRSTDIWVDFNFFGHQLVIHQTNIDSDVKKRLANPVDGHNVPVPHFGVVLEWEDWENLAIKLRRKDIKFVIEPYIRFKGQVGEQGTMFCMDPEGNAMEFKAFKDIKSLFAK